MKKRDILRLGRRNDHFSRLYGGNPVSPGHYVEPVEEKLVRPGSSRKPIVFNSFH